MKLTPLDFADGNREQIPATEQKAMRRGAEIGKKKGATTAD